jgi:aldehyde:ferredoxin oxidoreductase
VTNTACNSHHGGWSAARLLLAGYDGIIIKGKADKPTYLYIDADGVELKDAFDVWGKDVHATVKFFQDTSGEKDLTVIMDEANITSPNKGSCSSTAPTCS